MSSFKDTNQTNWTLDIKLRHVEEIKRHCFDRNGKPIDLLNIAESGNLEQIVNDIETLVNVVFVICYDQVRERFRVTEYDTDNASTYEMIPDWKTESEKVKASRWFGGLLNGKALIELTDAFQEALIDFFPNESRKTALKKIVEKTKELDQIQMEAILNTIDEEFPKAVIRMQEQTKRQFKREVSDALFGNVPELSELIPLPSVYES